MKTIQESLAADRNSFGMGFLPTVPRFEEYPPTLDGIDEWALGQGFTIGFYPFHDNDELDQIDTIIRLGKLTCSERAAIAYENAHFDNHYRFGTLEVESFDEGLRELKRQTRSMLLVPHLHPINKVLAADTDIRTLENQSFTLPNPRMYLAKARGGMQEGEKAYILNALEPFLSEAFNGNIPYPLEYAKSTADSARKCEINGGHAVVPEHQLEPFHLEPEKELRRANVLWKFYVYRPPALEAILREVE